MSTVLISIGVTILLLAAVVLILVGGPMLLLAAFDGIDDFSQWRRLQAQERADRNWYKTTAGQAYVEARGLKCGHTIPGDLRRPCRLVMGHDGAHAHGFPAYNVDAT